LYNAGSTNWLANRASTQNILSQALPAIPGQESARDLIFPAIRWLALIPSWAILLMVILATTAVCATVIVRARGEFQASSHQFSRMTAEIESLRETNGALKVEIHRLTSDSQAIELAARERLGMVRPNDIVVPIETIASSNLGTITFVR
jgi:cell division protein FtsB